MRQPLTLKIKFKSASLDQFIERYSVDVSRGGIFIRTKEPIKVGTTLKFEFQLQDASALISGEGTVVWIREHDPARTGVAPGMGVRFDKLASSSNGVLEQILAEKSRRGEAQVESRFDAGVRASASASGVVNNARRPSDFEAVDSKAGTPLPQPAPGLDGAEEEFGQESTRVMQDDVVQRLAEKTRDKPGEFADEVTRARGPEELAQLLRQTGPGETADSIDKTSVDEHALPALPPRAPAPPVISSAAPPPPATKPGRAEFVEPVTRADTPVLPPRAAAPPKQPLAPELPPPPSVVVEKASPVAVALEIGQHAMANERPPTRSKSSPMPVIIGIVAIAACAAIYVVMTGKLTAPPTVAVTEPVKPSEAVPPTDQQPTDPEAAGAKEPATPAVAISSQPPGATITIDGKAHDAPTPTTLNGLDPKRSYDVVIALKGYRDWTGKVQAKEGAKVEAKLVANEKVVEVSSTPAGAELYLDGKKIGRTPFTIHKFDSAGEHKLELRRGGFITQTRRVAASDTWDSKIDGRDVLALAVTLEPEPPKAKPPVTGKHSVPTASGKKPDGVVTGERVTPEPVTPSGDKPPADTADKPVEMLDKPAEAEAEAEAEKVKVKVKVKLPPPPKEKPGEGAE